MPLSGSIAVRFHLRRMLSMSSVTDGTTTFTIDAAAKAVINRALASSDCVDTVTATLTDQMNEGNQAGGAIIIQLLQFLIANLPTLLAFIFQFFNLPIPVPPIPPHAA